MRRSKKAMLAAGLIAGAAAMTGCASMTNPVATATPAANEQATAEPATAEPAADATPEAESPETEDAPIALRVDGQEADVGALVEEGKVLLPIIETGRLLGWDPDEQALEDETQTRYTIALAKGDSRISITWVTSDNTIKQITWQRDGLLVPVDASLTSVDDVIYAPAAFFEQAMEASVDRVADRIEVTPANPSETPPMEGAVDE